MNLSAKRYLEQLETIDMNINHDLERLEEMKSSAGSVGSIDYSKDRVQTSMQEDKLCNDVIRYIAFNEEINEEIDRFADAKKKIISEIRGLHEKKYIEVLYKIYVQYKSIKVASQEMKISYSYTLELHKKALSVFSDTYKNLLYLT